MTKNNKRLTDRQLAVIEDLFGGAMTEEAILTRHNLSRRLYRKWLADELFTGELQFRIESARWQSRFILARYAPTAAAKLVALTEAEKQETVRRACLDVIGASLGGSFSSDAEPDTDDTDPDQITPETATRLLEFLAKETRDDRTQNTSD